MRKKYKIGLIIISVLLVGVIGIGILRIFYNADEPKKETNVSSIISKISDYGYSLDDRDTQYMKEVFKELESVLEEEEIDYDLYATLLSKLFVIDFYTLNNKINKYDIGGLEYILSSKVEEFKLKAMDTIYRDIIDNTYRDRIQDLPEITNVVVDNLEKTTYTLNDEEVQAIKVVMKYEYKEDLGYDTQGTIYLIKNDFKLEIVAYNPSV